MRGSRVPRRRAHGRNGLLRRHLQRRYPMTAAVELGMTTTKDDKLGFSPCQLTEIAAARYRASIDTIAEALTLYRHPEIFETKERTTNNNNGVVAQCGCPRKLRVSNAVFEAGP